MMWIYIVRVNSIFSYYLFDKINNSRRIDLTMIHLCIQTHNIIIDAILFSVLGRNWKMSSTIRTSAAGRVVWRDMRMEIGGYDYGMWCTVATDWSGRRPLSPGTDYRCYLGVLRTYTILVVWHGSFDRQFQYMNAFKSTYEYKTPHSFVCTRSSRLIHTSPELPSNL